MTEKHPLTDDIAEVIANPARWPDDLGDVVFTYDDMRNAADWQLVQVIEQWEEVINSNKTDIQIIREFDKRLKAMRPQDDTP